MRDYRGQFEVHLTVRPSNAAGLEKFREWCRARCCKCLHIVLARGDNVEQPMASWRRGDTTLPRVVAEARQFAAELDCVSAVVRVKVEADPCNEDVPEHDADAALHDASNYFEHHVKLLRHVTDEKETLLQACQKHGAHLSRNAWREPAQGQEERFVTLRCYHVGRASSERQLQRLLAALHELGEQVIEIESEYSVHDSNLELDAGWLPRMT